KGLIHRRDAKTPRRWDNRMVITHHASRVNYDTRHAQIGIDASRALVAQRTGTEQYSVSLLRAFAALPEAQELTFVLYVNTASGAEARERLGFEVPRNWQIRAIPFPRLWTHARLSLEMVVRPPDVLFVPSHVVPL